MRTTQLLSIATLAITASFAAQAEGYGKGHYVDQTLSGQRSSAEVRAEAQNPVQITNGGTGVESLPMAVTREQKREEAALALRRGEIPSGERSFMQRM